MSLVDLIKNRRTVREYDPTFTIPKADMDKLIEVAQNSPTGMNIQGLDLIIVVNRQKIDAITSVVYNSLPAEGKAHFDVRRAQFGVKNNVMTCDASAMFFVVKNERAQGNFTEIDAGEMVMSVMIAARSLGYETMNVGAIIGNKEGVEKALGVEKGRLVTSFVVGKAKPELHLMKKEIKMGVHLVE